MSFFKKLFLGCFALGFILIGGSGTQSSNMLLQGGGFIGLVLGLVALYLFTKMAWRAMGCLPSFIVIMSIVCFVVYAIGGFNNGLSGIIGNLESFIGHNRPVAAPQVLPQSQKPSEQAQPAVNENFSDQAIDPPPSQMPQTEPAQPQNSGGLAGFLQNLTGKPAQEPAAADINSLPTFTSPVKVISGDTLNAQGYIVKIYGIAAPMLNQTCANRQGASYACGRQATIWLQTWLQEYPVTCRVVSQAPNGNMLGICSLGEYDIGAAIVNAGWAVANPKEADIYLPYEENARKQRNGLWQGDFYKPWDWQAIQHRKPQYKVKVIQPKDPNRKSFFKK